MTDEQMIMAILKREGSAYTNHPNDRGGPTRYGVTQATLAAYRGKPVTPADVEALTEVEAVEVYRTRYIIEPGFSKITSNELRSVVVDFGVNSGPAAATRALQKSLGVTVDGVMGPQTVEAANTKLGRSLAVKVCCQRMRYLGRIITDNPSQSVFAAGWMNRVADMIEDVV